MNTKKFILSIVVLLFCIAITGCGKLNKKKNIEDMNGSELLDAIDASVDAISKRVGSKQMGYITIPSKWSKYTGKNSQTTALKYSNRSGNTIITLDIVDKARLDAKEPATKQVADNMWNNFENGGATVSGSRSEFQGYNSFKLHASFPNGLQSIVWIFESEDGQVHFVAIESPDEDTFNRAFLMATTTFSFSEKGPSVKDYL